MWVKRASVSFQHQPVAGKAAVELDVVAPARVACGDLARVAGKAVLARSEEHTSELQSPLFPYTTLFRSISTSASSWQGCGRARCGSARPRSVRGSRARRGQGRTG